MQWYGAPTDVEATMQLITCGSCDRPYFAKESACPFWMRSMKPG